MAAVHKLYISLWNTVLNWLIFHSSPLKVIVTTCIQNEDPIQNTELFLQKGESPPQITLNCITKILLLLLLQNDSLLSPALFMYISG